MSFGPNRTRLTALTKDLLVQWDETKQYWRDAKCQEFEQRYMEDLIGGVNMSVNVMEKLDKLVEKIKKDCE